MLRSGDLLVNRGLKRWVLVTKLMGSRGVLVIKGDADGTIDEVLGEQFLGSWVQRGWVLLSSGEET